jgi:hypothetical protein
MNLAQLRTTLTRDLQAGLATLHNDARYQWLKAHLAPQSATILPDGTVQYVLTVTLTSPTLSLDLDALIDTQLTQEARPSSRRRTPPQHRRTA